MKDYHDIYYLSHKFSFDGEFFSEALRKTFVSRQHNFIVEQFEQIAGFVADDEVVRSGWLS